MTWKPGTWSPIQQLEFSEEFTGLSFKRYQAWLTNKFCLMNFNTIIFSMEAKWMTLHEMLQ